MSSGGVSGSREVGTTAATGEERDDDDRDVQGEHRAPGEVFEQPAAGDGADGNGAGRRPWPRARWPSARSLGSVKTLVRIDSVVGMISAPPIPMNGACGDELDRRVRQHARRRIRVPNTTRPALSAPRRPNRSPSAPAEQEQAGEDEHIAVDDPLQLAPARPRGLERGWEGHVEDRVVHDDEQQAHVEDGEGPPALRAMVAGVHLAAADDPLPPDL